MDLLESDAGSSPDEGSGEEGDEALANTSFNFDDCTGLTTIDGLGNGLDLCQAPRTCEFQCRRLHWLDNYWWSQEQLGRVPGPRKYELQFRRLRWLDNH